MPDDFRDLAAEFRNVDKRMLPKVRGAITRNTNAVARRARDDAPRDRPWLATEGIVVERSARGMTGAVKTVPDPTKPSAHRPEGEDVGMDVEYGTSVMAPQPFMTPALKAQEPMFVADLERIISEVAKK